MIELNGRLFVELSETLTASLGRRVDPLAASKALDSAASAEAIQLEHGALGPHIVGVTDIGELARMVMNYAIDPREMDRPMLTKRRRGDMARAAKGGPDAA